MNPREYPTQPVCGVGVVCLRDDKVLLVKRAKAPITWQWSIPGGGQELGETTRTAALRELQEETGVDAELIGLIDVIDTIREDDSGRIQYHYTLVDFVAVWTSGEPVADDDVSDARWVPLSEIEKYDLWFETIRVIRKAVKIRGEIDS
ncbi:MAG: RNA pyrophosphohydrolase [Alphaproteobacteria bacterium MarineAlpha11_Bin1]|nr:MAG: RNA pyrophosphohydrolase [Alphaproteobacteria bacterium MarineAlpha11_Bin1]|tara:strand:- start:247 stop:690 length:444 start_codon:yes stop_codon:yes gene_type:complete